MNRDDKKKTWTGKDGGKETWVGKKDRDGESGMCEERETGMARKRYRDDEKETCVGKETHG